MCSYIASEVSEGGHVSQAGDVFSMGVVMLQVRARSLSLFRFVLYSLVFAVDIAAACQSDFLSVWLSLWSACRSDCRAELTTWALLMPTPEHPAHLFPIQQSHFMSIVTCAPLL